MTKDEIRKVLVQTCVRLGFWMGLITFVITIGIPLLGHALADLYQELKAYMVEDAGVIESASISLFGLF